MDRALTFTAAGGLVVAGAALRAIVGHGDGRVEPLLPANDPTHRRNGAPRPGPVPAERVVDSLEDVRAPGRHLEALA